MRARKEPDSAPWMMRWSYVDVKVTALLIARRESVEGADAANSAGYSIAPVAMIAPCPGIRRGTEAVVPSVPGLVSEIVVPSKSGICSLPERARAIRSSDAATNRAKSSFLAAASHDLRHPLHAHSALTLKWKWLRGSQNCPDGHQMRIVDVNGDGTDDVAQIGFVLNGTSGALLYTLGTKGVVHGDRFHIGKFEITNGQFADVLNWAYRGRLLENASGGTDHGYGTVMLALGGSVNGGNIYGTFPGLAGDQLFEGAEEAPPDVRQPGVARERDDARHLSRSCDPHDGGRPAIDPAVENSARLVVSNIARCNHAAVEGGAELWDRDVFNHRIAPCF